MYRGVKRYFRHRHGERGFFTRGDYCGIFSVVLRNKFGTFVMGDLICAKFRYLDSRYDFAGLTFAVCRGASTTLV